MTNETENVAAARNVELTLTEPLSVAPQVDLNASGPVGGPFDPPQVVYTISSASASEIDWEVSVDQSWVSIDGLQGGGAPVAGTLDALQPNVDVTVGFDASATALQAGTYTATVTMMDLCTGQEFTRSVVLQVGPSITVTPPDDAAFGATTAGPCNPDSAQYTIATLAQSPVNWEVVADGSP
ncbi:MAG: hypothetical protein ACYSUI_22270, partial [Planctomycetota bacterium]